MANSWVNTKRRRPGLWVQATVANSGSLSIHSHTHFALQGAKPSTSGIEAKGIYRRLSRLYENVPLPGRRSRKRERDCPGRNYRRPADGSGVATDQPNSELRSLVGWPAGRRIGSAGRLLPPPPTPPDMRVRVRRFLAVLTDRAATLSLPR
jgi:hypothetical protein